MNKYVFDELLGAILSPGWISFSFSVLLWLIWAQSLIPVGSTL